MTAKLKSQVIIKRVPGMSKVPTVNSKQLITPTNQQQPEHNHVITLLLHVLHALHCLPKEQQLIITPPVCKRQKQVQQTEHPEKYRLYTQHTH